MNLSKLTPLCALLLCVACDPDSQSLGEEPTETASGSGDAPVSADADVVITRQGTAISHIDVRSDGATVVAGPSGYAGLFGDLVVYENDYVGVFDADGTLLWEDEQPKPVNDVGEIEEGAINGIGTGPDGSVFVAHIDYADIDESSNRVTKYDADGTVLWEAGLAGRPSDVAGTDDGGALVVGLIGDEDDPNVAHGWAARLDSAGAIVSEQRWESDEGRGTLFEHVAISEDDAMIIGGRFGTSPASSQSDAWLLSVDDDLNVDWELRLSPSGATDRIYDLRFNDAGTLLAIAGLGDLELVSVGASGELLSSEPVDPDLAPLSVYAPDSYLAVERSNCAETIGSDPGCGLAPFRGVEGGGTRWDLTIEGCNANTGLALDASESLVSVGCNFMNADGDWDFRGELHRIVID